MNNKNRENTILHIYVLLTDLIGNTVSLILAFAIRYGRLLGISRNFDGLWLLWILLIITFLVDGFMSPINRYITRGPFAEFIDVIKHQLADTVILILILYLAHNADALSRLVFIYFIISSIIINLVLRRLVKWYLLNVYKKGTSTVKLVIITDEKRKEKLNGRISDSAEWKTVVTNTINIDETDYSSAVSYMIRNEVDEVLISVDRSYGDPELKRFISELVSMGIKVDIDINQFELDIPGKKYLDIIENHAVVSISRNTIRISQSIIKRLMDIVGGIIGTVLFLITYIILGPIIKLDSPGPVLFVQKRVGKNGRIFDFYKFRSMYQDAEERKKALQDQNEVNGLMFKMEDDPRITKVGKFIRKTSIDEIPQFWNVLKGDMSLVGTRPPTVDEYERYEPWHKSRLSMKPGITGLWQISGRSDIKNFDEVVKLDMQYIDNWSIGEDIKIILKTIGVVITGKGSK